MQARRASVARIVAAALVTVATLVLAGVGALDYFLRRNDEWNRLRRVTVAQTDELAVALALPAWNIDRPQIEKILDSQSDASPIEGVIVRVSGKTHARMRDARRRFVPSDGRFDPTGLLWAERTIVFKGQRIGMVRLFTTPKLIESRLRDTLIAIVAAIVAIDLILILSVYRILWLAVLRPLVQIERYAGAVSMGRDDEASSVPPASTAELDSLRVSIETMVGLLDRRYLELQEQAARLFQSEERFRTIYESANDAIFIDDADSGAILDVNERVSEMFGYTREEALTLDIAALSSGVEPYTQQNALELLREARQGAPRIFEWHCRHRDGQLFWAEVSMRIATIEGKPRMIIVVRDIERRKEMEGALRRNETLSVMGALVAGVAHEVRNPLFGMSALLDAYAGEIAAARLTELSSALREQVTRLTHLMSELLEFGRPVKITPEPDSVCDLIDEVIHSRADAAARAHVALQCVNNGHLPAVLMDRYRLRQVFENLIDNALQHAPAVRTVTVTGLELVYGGRSWIECTIEDDGSGFEPADLERVFEPFYTRRDSGIGLGMSIVQRIVQEHGGRVSAANGAHGGAIVTVRLPAAASEMAAAI